MRNILKGFTEISSTIPKRPEATLLTKREYFAVMIFQGIIAGQYMTPDYAATAVIMADNLIKELNKESK